MYNQNRVKSYEYRQEKLGNKKYMTREQIPIGVQFETSRNIVSIILL